MLVVKAGVDKAVTFSTKVSYPWTRSLLWWCKGTHGGIVTRELTGSGAKPSHHRLQRLKVKRPRVCLCTISKGPLSTLRHFSAVLAVKGARSGLCCASFAPWIARSDEDSQSGSRCLPRWCNSTHDRIGKRGLAVCGARPSQNRLRTHALKFHHVCICTTNSSVN